ncbi:hypothetical protein ACFZBU_39770 [Embleya sp. NPDC008237]|uniref:hypothetical protein n=1 Tax=Embleya sp. NPDC008237 TaxID=3363978 RepID=UPI0036E138C2
MSILTGRTAVATAGDCSVTLTPSQDFGWLVINACCTGCPAGKTWNTEGGDTRDARVRISDAARAWAAGHAEACRVPRPNTTLGR